MKYAVIYNLASGEIACMSTITDVSARYNGLVVYVPAGKILKRINPSTQEPIFENIPVPPMVVEE